MAEYYRGLRYPATYKVPPGTTTITVEFTNCEEPEDELEIMTMGDESKSGETWTWTNWHHKYVELHVRALERVPALDKKVSVPGWVAKVMNYPDSTTRGGKSLGYHVAHATAILLPFVALFGIGR